MESADQEMDLTLVIASRREDADGVVLLKLRDAEGRELPEWTPGSHIDLHLSPQLVRQYSLCGDPAQRDIWTLGILRDPKSRGGSILAHDRLREGDQVLVRGPRNHFRFEPSDSYLFIAGGIGITPLLPMARQAQAAGAEWSMLYGGRTLGSMAFRDTLAQLGGDRVQIRPEDRFGLLDLPSVLDSPRADTAVYCCGPEPLIRAVESLSTRWPEGSLHVERFAPRELQAPTGPDSFVVELAQSGIELTVPPDKSILDVVLDAGIDAPSSCEEGTCGTCETVVLLGIPEHRDSVYTPEQHEKEGTMQICVSRSRSPRLVLDL